MSEYERLSEEELVELLRKANGDAPISHGFREITDEVRRALLELRDSRERIAALQEQLRKGTAEIRRYVEASGFEWQDADSAVFNVTTALGWMGGTIDAQHEHIAAMDAPQPCGHPARYIEASDDGTQHCVMCFADDQVKQRKPLEAKVARARERMAAFRDACRESSNLSVLLAAELCTETLDAELGTGAEGGGGVRNAR